MITGGPLVTHSSLTRATGSNPGRGTLVNDLSFHPLGVNKLSTSFGCWLKCQCNNGLTSNTQGFWWRLLIQKLRKSFCKCLQHF